MRVTEKSWIAGAGKQGAMYMKPTKYTNLTACVDNSAETREALFKEALAHRLLLRPMDKDTKPTEQGQ